MKRSLCILLAFITISISCKKTAPTPQFTITATSGANGSISPIGATTVSLGATMEYDIVPIYGDGIATVTVDGVPIPVTSLYTFHNVNSDHTISATFGSFITVTAASRGNGTVTPFTTNVASGGSLVLTFTPDDTYHADSLWIDGVFTKVLGGATSYTLTNVTASHAIMVSFSGVILTKAQLDSLGSLLVGSWHYIQKEQKIQSLGGTLPWQLQPLGDCELDDYEVYKIDGNYTSYLNGTSCTPTGPTIIDFTGTWSFGPDGKIIYYRGNYYKTDTFFQPAGSSITVNKLTKDSLVITYPAVYQIPAVLTRVHYTH